MGSAGSFLPARDIPSLEGKVILVTGGNAGLGKATIQYLAAHGPSRIYMAARTPSKAQSAIASIRSAIPNAEIEHLQLDLTSFESIAEAAKAFKSKEKRLDILINNAGIMAVPYSTTKEGYEIQFGTNHVGHALLTKLLMPVLLETAKQPGADVRIVNVSSMGHLMAPSGGIIFDQQALESYMTARRYGVSKLANILFTRELAARYPQITSVSLHPGVILTDLYTTVRKNWILNPLVYVYGGMMGFLPGHFKDAAGGALNQVWAATTPKDNLKNGEYYRPVGVHSFCSPYAKDLGLAKKLWDWTEGEFQKHGY